MKTVHARLPDGRKFEIPADVVAKVYARLKEFDLTMAGETYRGCREDLEQDALESDDILILCCQKMASWVDFENDARQVFNEPQTKELETLFKQADFSVSGTL